MRLSHPHTLHPSPHFPHNSPSFSIDTPCNPVLTSLATVRNIFKTESLNLSPDSTKVRHLMLKRPFKSVIARIAIVALALSLVFPFIPAAFADGHIDLCVLRRERHRSRSLHSPRPTRTETPSSGLLTEPTRNSSPSMVESSRSKSLPTTKTLNPMRRRARTAEQERLQHRKHHGRLAAPIPEGRHQRHQRR